MAPRRRGPSDRAMTTLRPPIRPTSDVTAPTIPLPTSGGASTRVTVTECRRGAGWADRGARPGPGAAAGAAAGSSEGVLAGASPWPRASARLLPERQVLHGHG